MSTTAGGRGALLAEEKTSPSPAPAPEPWLHGIRLLTFDCYGTLVDWEQGVMRAFARHVCPGFYVGQLAEVMEAWEEIQFGLIQGPYRPYREILAESVRRTVAALGLPRPEDDGVLGCEMGTFPPFPDTRAALRALSSRASLWILSNADNDILDETLRLLGSPIGRAITAEDVRSYKPAPRHFEEALDRSGLAPREVLHVAFGFRYDIVPAQRLGMRTAWVNRAGDARPADVVPDLEVPDLRSLADLAARWR